MGRFVSGLYWINTLKDKYLNSFVQRGVTFVQNAISYFSEKNDISYRNRLQILRKLHIFISSPDASAPSTRCDEIGQFPVIVMHFKALQTMAGVSQTMQQCGQSATDAGMLSYIPAMLITAMIIKTTNWDAKILALGRRVGQYPQGESFALDIQTCWYLKTLKFALPPTPKLKFALPPTPNAIDYSTRTQFAVEYGL